MSRIRPVSDNVVVRLDLFNRKSASGLIALPDLPHGPTAKAWGSEYGSGIVSGVVVSAGPGSRKHPVTLREGDRVLIDYDGGDRIVGGDIADLDEDPASELRLLREPQVIAVIESAE